MGHRNPRWMGFQAKRQPTVVERQCANPECAHRFWVISDRSRRTFCTDECRIGHYDKKRRTRGAASKADR